jgi:hypothetical protein
MSAIKNLIRTAIRRYPTIPRFVWQAIYPLLQRENRWAGDEYSDRKNAFTTIYKENRWGSPESVSGIGSTLDFTGSVRSLLPRILEDLKVRTYLDAPCGDFNWAKQLQLPPGTRYIGGDIVDSLIADLQSRHADATHSFINLDIVDGQLPAADLWLCRHVLFHLSTEDIMATLRNFAASSIDWLLTDSLATIRTNSTIKSGGFRLVNLEAAPYNLPNPTRKFPDYYPPDAPVHLCLWSRAQVAAVSSNWPERPAA